MTTGAFGSVDLVIETVSSVAGSGKTLTAIALALHRALTEGARTIFAMPTLELIAEMAEVARRQNDVPVMTITSETETDFAANEPRKRTTARLTEHLQRRTNGGEVVFVTHETMHRMGQDYPDEAGAWELVIDEAPETILARAPFRLYDNWRILTAFLELGEPITDSPGLRRARKRAEDAGLAAAQAVIEPRLLMKMEKTVQAIERLVSEGPDAAGVTREQRELAVKTAPAYRARYEETLAKARTAMEKAEAESADLMLQPYCELMPITVKRVQRRVNLAPVDDVYQLLHPVANWVSQGCPIFAQWQACVEMMSHQSSGPMRGQVSVCGFRRPDALGRFQRITLFGALLEHSLCWAVWQSLGVRFVPSQLIRLAETTTLLGPRRLKIFWLTDQNWSKTLRDRSGGIAPILEAIAKAAVIDPSEAVCVVVNKDDGSENNPELVRKFFPTALVMPHRVEGQNRFRHIHQLVHCAALNNYTPDIRFFEAVLGIDAHDQRIARTGYAVYQSLMRLSLRDPTAKRDVILVVMDKDVAEWLPKWFSPSTQVVVEGIDAGIARKRRHGRPTIGARPMTDAERKRRQRRALP